MSYNWTSILGKFDAVGADIIHKGETIEYPGYGNNPSVGNLLTDISFGEGKVSVDIEFSEISITSGCQVIIYYDANSGNFLSAGLGSGVMYIVRTYAQTWTIIKAIGAYHNLQPNRKYSLEIQLSGSNLTMIVDRIKVLSTNLQFNLPVTQIGIWSQSNMDIKISNLKVERSEPKAFIVMPFSSPYNELYEDVIRPVCSEKMKLNPIRGDETYGPGLIISDIVHQITSSKVVIAEITEMNANVFYEVGYAHAMGKPTILLAHKGTKLPFDVSPFRTLFYENTISGKQKVEIGLEKHLKTSLSELDL